MCVVIWGKKGVALVQNEPHFEFQLRSLMPN